MKIVWDKYPITASEIISRLRPGTAWNSKTIHTLIGRLVNKNVLGVNKEAKYYEYYPLVNQAECTREETQSFLEKVYNGSLNLLVANFLKEKKLSNQEIEELQQILDKNKGG
jgi:BlaI family penicillinase repressor